MERKIKIVTKSTIIQKKDVCTQPINTPLVKLI